MKITRHPAARFALLVLAYALVILALDLVSRGHVSLDADQILSSVTGGLVVTLAWMVLLSVKSARANAPTETRTLNGSDDALMRRATVVLRARGIGGVNVDRPARTVRGRRVTVAVEPDVEKAGLCRVIVRAAPLLASRQTDWDAYRALAAGVARDLAEFRTTTAETPSPPGTPSAG